MLTRIPDDAFIVRPAENGSAADSMILDRTDVNTTLLPLLSSTSHVSQHHHDESLLPHRGSCSFAQSTFNAINVLIGVGVLSLPFAFKITGWVIGFTLLVAFMILTNFSARLIARSLDYRPSTINVTGINSQQQMTTDYGTTSLLESAEKKISGYYGHDNCSPVVSSRYYRVSNESDSFDASKDDECATKADSIMDISSSSSSNDFIEISSESTGHENTDGFKPMMTYSEIGYAAFKTKGKVFISLLFTLELFAAAVALIILIADSLHSLFPRTGLINLKIIAFFIVTPSMWLPNLKYLSYGSILGIIAILNLLAVVVIDGLSTNIRPGSLLNPAETHLWSPHLLKLPISFGLIMSGFAGHAVFPNIYREMKQPSRFNALLNTSYIVTFLVYTTMAATGYLMFGEATLDEITKNIAQVPAYNATLNTLTIWLIAINPMTKYALTLQPVASNFEYWLKSLPNVSSARPYKVKIYLWRPFGSIRVPYQTIRLGFRTFLSGIVLIIAIIFPGFERIISLLGSLFSFIVSVIFPIACYLKLFRFELSYSAKFGLWILMIISCIMAGIGTIWAVLPHNVIGIESRMISNQPLSSTQDLIVHSKMMRLNT